MPWFLLLILRHRLRTTTLDKPPPTFLASVVSAVKQALAAEQLLALNLLATPATSFATSWPMTAMLGGVLASSMPKLHFWQPRALAFHLSLRLLPLPQSKVGLILFYLSLSLHLPWLLCLALVVFLWWPRCLFSISCSWSALAFCQFLQNLWARLWLENLLNWMSC